MKLRIDNIQLFLKELKSRAKWVGLICLCLITCSMKVFATDSSGISNPTSTFGSPTFSVTGAFKGCYPTGSKNASQASPCQLTDNTSGLENITVPYSGYYFYTANIVYYANTGTPSDELPINLWLDAWATSNDLSGKSQDIRIFYTGENPLPLYHDFATGTYTFWMYGGSYLSAGSVIWLPRAWTDNGNKALWGVNGGYGITLLSNP